MRMQSGRKWLGVGAAAEIPGPTVTLIRLPCDDMESDFRWGRPATTIGQAPGRDKFRSCNRPPRWHVVAVRSTANRPASR